MSASFVDKGLSTKPFFSTKLPKKEGFVEFRRKLTFNETEKLKRTYLSILYMLFFGFRRFVEGGVISPLFLPFLGVLEQGYIRGSFFFYETSLHAPAITQPRRGCPRTGVMLQGIRGRALDKKSKGLPSHSLENKSNLSARFCPSALLVPQNSRCDKC